MFYTVTILSPLLPTFTDLHARLLLFESQLTHLEESTPSNNSGGVSHTALLSSCGCSSFARGGHGRLTVQTLVDVVVAIVIEDAHQTLPTFLNILRLLLSSVRSAPSMDIVLSIAISAASRVSVRG